MRIVLLFALRNWIVIYHANMRPTAAVRDGRMIQKSITQELLYDQLTGGYRRRKGLNVCEYPYQGVCIPRVAGYAKVNTPLRRQPIIVNEYHYQPD